jgi:hypothetical protein
MRRNRVLLLAGILTGVVCIGVVAVISGLFSQPSWGPPLTSSEIRDLERLLGVSFPPSTWRLRAWYSFDRANATLHVRVDCAKLDAENVAGSFWLTIDHAIRPEEAGTLFVDPVPPYARRGDDLWTAQPLRPNDKLYRQVRQTNLPLSTRTAALIRIEGNQAVIFLVRSGSSADFPPDLSAALRQYDLIRDPFPSQQNVYGRQWP